MKRGASGLCFVVGVDKPAGLSSHDVVNRCRRIFGERRVGHAGTLDPLASGVLPILVGPATRLDHYLVGHNKSYSVQIAFGYSTTTDDTEGEILDTGRPTELLLDADYAKHYLEGIIGKQMQIPPVYSAIKKGGRKACDVARKGEAIELEPREVEIYSANLKSLERAQCSSDIEADGLIIWDVELSVSKGTYIRSIARDAGSALGCPAHVRGLRRTAVGALGLERCVGLEVLEREGIGCAIDPAPLLGFPAFFAGEAQRKALANGSAISKEGIVLYDIHACGVEEELCSCTSRLTPAANVLSDGECVSVLSEGKLSAIYRYDASGAILKPACVFSTGVSRGDAV